MKMTLSRSLMIFAALGVPMAAGGMVALTIRKDATKPAYLECKSRPTGCGQCCDAPSKQEFVLAMADDKPVGKTDCPLFGGTPERNLVNVVDKGIPAEWSVEEGKEKNIKWSAELGNKSYGGPVIANGRIYVGTNNATPRDPKIEGHKAILMAFNESDGKYLWQIVHDFPPDEAFKEAIGQGLCSTPHVVGDGIYYVTPGCEVVRANPEGKVVWKYDMMKELHVMPFHLANCSPLVVDDHVLVVTGNGVDEEGHLHDPKAPSFVAIHKDTGKLVWKSSLPGDKIIEGQWSNPTLAVVKGKKQVIFPGGDAVLYSLDPKTGELIWKFDCHPTRPKDQMIVNYFIATPVVVDDRMYIGLGVYPEHPQGTKFSHVYCIDVTKKGDVSPKSLDGKDPANKDSALIWTFGGAIEPRPKSGRPVYFGRTISTCAVHDGLVYAAEESGYLHCLDAKTGERKWVEDLKSGVWGSPYYVDGKVTIGTEDGTIYVYDHGPKKNEIAAIDFGETIHSTPVVANGVLYITTRSKLYAIAEKK